MTQAQDSWPLAFDYRPEPEMTLYTQGKVRECAEIAAKMSLGQWDWGQRPVPRHNDKSLRVPPIDVVKAAGYAAPGSSIRTCFKGKLFRAEFDSAFERLRGPDAEVVSQIRQRLEDAALFTTYYSAASGVPLVLDPYEVVTLEAMATHKRLVLLMPATHGKSTLSKWYVIWRICQNPNIRIIFVLRTDGESKKMALAIRSELEKNPALIRDFGPFKPEGKQVRWNNREMDVAKRQITESQPTIEFSSSSTIAQVLGHRCDEGLLDDIVTPETVNTQSLRDQQEDIFDVGIDTGPQYLWNRDSDGHFTTKPDHIVWPEDLRPYGQPVVYEKLTMLGTVFHPDDLFHRKGRSPQDLVPGVIYDGHVEPWKVLYWDCWKHDDDNVPTDEPLMPSRWTAEKLHQEERSKGSISFSKRYRNIAIDEGSTVFKKLWIIGDKDSGGDFCGCLDDGMAGRPLRSWGELPYSENGGVPAKWRLSLGVDPASGRTGDAVSWTAFVLLAVDDQAAIRERWLLDIYKAQIGPEDIISRVLFGDRMTGVDWGFYDRYHFNIVAIEKNANNRYLLENARLLAAKVDFRFDTMGIETQAASKVAMVSGLQNLFVDGHIHIPYALTSDREKAADLIEELQLFPQGKQDYPMSLAFADQGVQQKINRYQCFSRDSGRTIHRSS